MLVENRHPPLPLTLALALALALAPATTLTLTSPAEHTITAAGSRAAPAD